MAVLCARVFLEYLIIHDDCIQVYIGIAFQVHLSTSVFNLWMIIHVFVLYCN